MQFIGVDLHKRVIHACVVVLEHGKRRVTQRKRFGCDQVQAIKEFFASLAPFEVVVEATANYPWFFHLVNPMASRFVLAHPRKLRIIAESTRKTDKIDAQILAELLAMDMIPCAHIPTPRQREHRVLVRQRHYVQRRRASVKTKLRSLLANYNVDIEGLFTLAGLAKLAEIEMSESDRFLSSQLVADLQHLSSQVKRVEKQLTEFSKSAPPAECEARQVLETIPGVGAITVDVVVSELGDIRRFRSQKQVVAYAGLAPGVRESASHSKQLGITKEGSKLLRWVLVEAAWRVVMKTRRWGMAYEKLKKRVGAKKAIVAIARRLLCVMASMLQNGRRYNLATEILS